MSEKKIREIKYYGVAACLALWQRRPQDIIRMYLEESRVKELSPMLKWCAANSKAYHIIPSKELAQVTDSIHHEGVCVLAKELMPVSFSSFLEQLPELGKNVCLLYLDGIENPHNLGSIMRASAHFGISYILGDALNLPSASPSCCRVAKGGAEWARLVPLQRPAEELRILKERHGFHLVSTSGKSGTSLYQHSYHNKTLIILGSESRGVSPYIRQLTTSTLMIPGTGHVESLNVAAATSLFLGEYTRQKSLSHGR